MKELATAVYEYELGSKKGNIAEAAAATSAGVKTPMLLAQVQSNPNVKSFLNKLNEGNTGGGMSKEGKALTNSIIAKWDSDKTSFISNLNKDLANPQTAAKLEAAIKSNPAGVSAALAQYTPGNLDKIIPQTAAPAVEKKETGAPRADSSADETARLARRNPGNTQASPKPANTAAAGAGSSSVSPMTVAAGTGSQTQTQAQQTSSPPPGMPSEKELARATLRQIAKGTDEEIVNAIDKDFVKGLADGLADYGADNFNLGPAANGFRNNVKTDGKLQQRIADNLRSNPQLIRELAGAMDNKDAAKGPAGSAIKGKLEEIYKNPGTLAQKDYTDSLLGDMKMAKGGIGGMLNNIFGEGTMSGVGGMVNGIGGFLKGIMSWFGNFIDAFSSGNFAVMGTVDPKMSFWNKISYSMDRAQNAAMLKDSAQVLPRDGATNPRLGNGMVVDAAGKPVMEDVLDNTGKPIGQRQKYDPTQDHRISMNGQKFYITGNIQPTPVVDINGQHTGKNRFVVATEVGPDGRATSVKEIVLGKEDTNKLMDRIDQAAKAAGVENRIVHPESAPARAQQGFGFAGTHVSQISSTYYDPKGRQIGDANRPPAYSELSTSNPNGGAVTSPVQPNGPVVGRPLDNAANDPTMKLTVGVPGT